MGEDKRVWRALGAEGGVLPRWWMGFLGLAMERDLVVITSEKHVTLGLPLWPGRLFFLEFDCPARAALFLARVRGLL